MNTAGYASQSKRTRVPTLSSTCVFSTPAKDTHHTALRVRCDKRFNLGEYGFHTGVARGALS